MMARHRRQRSRQGVRCPRVVFPCPAPPAPVPGSSSYGYQLGFNQHELRLSFTWPILPNGKISTQNQPQTFRATIAGQIVPDLNSLGANNLYQRYFYQAQSFAPNTNAP